VLGDLGAAHRLPETSSIGVGGSTGQPYLDHVGKEMRHATASTLHETGRSPAGPCAGPGGCGRISEATGHAIAVAIMVALLHLVSSHFFFHIRHFLQRKEHM
jgi:hypothetical protein